MTGPPAIGGLCRVSSNESGSRGPTQAEPGDAEAQYNLALSYYEGEGGVADYPAAREWYERAADRVMPPPSTTWR